MGAFLASLPDSTLPAAVDIAVVDDGSPLVGEILNLMARRNLLFEAVPKEAPDVALNVRIGSKAFPLEGGAEPGGRRPLGAAPPDGREALAAALRHRGGPGPPDPRRRPRACLHLLNYGGRPIDGLRVRLLGELGLRTKPGLSASRRVAVEDLVSAEGATEFSLGVIDPYAIVDLTAAR